MPNYEIIFVNGMPTVFDKNTGQVVQGALVIAISFPSGQVHGANGSVGYITGPGTAEIEVNGVKIKGVPLR